LTGSDSPRSWRGALDAYARPRLARSLVDVATSVVPYLVLMAAMVLALQVSWLLSLLLVVPAAGFLLRTFIVFHDCTHGSFLRSRRANDMLGTGAGSTSMRCTTPRLGTSTDAGSATSRR